MTDGGLADSIPVIRAYEQGARRITVILSQPLGFKKTPARFPSLLKPLFSDYPALFEAVTRRTDQYNAALDFIANPPCRLSVTYHRATTKLPSLSLYYGFGLTEHGLCARRQRWFAIYR